MIGRWPGRPGVIDHPLVNAAVLAAAALVEVLDYRAGRRVIAGEVEHLNGELDGVDQVDEQLVDAGP